MRDVLAVEIADGTAQIQKIIIARERSAPTSFRIADPLRGPSPTSGRAERPWSGDATRQILKT